jgi:hypothetical protein
MVAPSHVDQPKVEFWCYVDPREAVCGDLCPPSLERPGSAVQPSHQPPSRCSYFPSHGVSSTPRLPSLFLPIAPPRRYHHVRSTLPRRRSRLSWQSPSRRLIGRGVGALSTARKPAFLQHRADIRIHRIWVKCEQEIKSKSSRNQGGTENRNFNNPLYNYNGIFIGPVLPACHWTLCVAACTRCSPSHRLHQTALKSNINVHTVVETRARKLSLSNLIS